MFRLTKNGGIGRLVPSVVNQNQLLDGSRYCSKLMLAMFAKPRSSETILGMNQRQFGLGAASFHPLNG